MPAYWSLGFHLSQYGYNSLENMQGAVDRMRYYDIPHVSDNGYRDYITWFLFKKQTYRKWTNMQLMSLLGETKWTACC